MPSNIVKFVHKNQIVRIHNPDSNETILNYIRTKLKKTGTKEGCAEGGCGACTIVLGELKKSKMGTPEPIQQCKEEESSYKELQRKAQNCDEIFTPMRFD